VFTWYGNSLQDLPTFSIGLSPRELATSMNIIDLNKLVKIHPLLLLSLEQSWISFVIQYFSLLCLFALKILTIFTCHIRDTHQYPYQSLGLFSFLNHLSYLGVVWTGLFKLFYWHKCLWNCLGENIIRVMSSQKLMTQNTTCRLLTSYLNQNTKHAEPLQHSHPIQVNPHNSL